MLGIINWNFKIETDILQLKIESGESSDYFVRSRQGFVVLVIPRDAKLADPLRQEWLRKVVSEILRKQAKMYLPKRINELAAKNGFKFNRLTIKAVRTRWGSCSSLGNINLSLYLMLFPSHLIDYVILHELCHTKEMNHGPRFWALLDSLTNNKAHALRKELNTLNRIQTIN